MQILKDRIIKEGKVVSETILKVDSFINHQIDPALMKAIGEEFVKRFEGEKITKVLTIESSGIPPAIFVGLALGVPVVFARKRKSATLADNIYSSKVHSFTKGETNDICVSKNFLSETDTVILIDDFLANGEALRGLMDVSKQAGARVVGAGIVIEKGFQKGGQELRAEGLRIESLVNIKSLEGGRVSFFE